MTRLLKVVAFFLLVMLLIFWKLLFHPEFTLIYGGDICSQTYPWFNAAGHWLKKGVLLIWDPYVYSGKPTLGELQPGILYPLNWLALLVPAAGKGIGLAPLEGLIVLHCLLAGLFSYLLARSFGLGGVASAATGVIFCTGGFSSHLWSWVNIYSGFAWMPLVAYLFRRALLAAERRERTRFFLWSAFFAALSLLAGHHAPLVHIGLFLFLYVLVMAILSRREAAWRARIVPFAALGLLPVAAALLAAVQLLPSAEYARFALRWVGEGDPVGWGEKIPYSVLGQTGNLNPQDFISLLLPYMSTSANLYVGAPVLFLALVGLLFARGRDARAFGILFFLYLLLCLGSLSSLHGWINSLLPGVWFAREVYLYLVPLQLCLALLAGWGFDQLLSCYSKFPDAALRAFVRRAGWGMALVVLGSAGIVVAAHVFAGLPWNHAYARAAALLAIYLTLLGTLVFFVHTGRMGGGVFGVLLLGLILLDLSSHYSDAIQPMGPAPALEKAAARDHWEIPRVAQYLLELRQQEVFRVDNPARLLSENFGDAWLIEETMGHGATARADYLAFRNTGWGPGSNATALLNARYFVSDVPVAGMPMPLKDEPLYRNPRAVPRAFAVSRYREFPESRDVLNWLPTPLMSPRGTVLLEAKDLERIPPALLDAIHNDDEGIDINVLSYWTSSERKAQMSDDEQQRYRLGLFRPPWGWSEGDELTISARPRTPGGGFFLVLDYWPEGTEVSRLHIRLEGSGKSAVIPVDLPGSEDNGKPPAGTREAVVPLGPLAADEYWLSLERTSSCSAKLDSIRITRNRPVEGSGWAGEVDVTSLQPNRLQLKATLARPGFVVVSGSTYPGWKASVDGTSTPLIKADHMLMALAVPAGAHEIVLRFRPATFQWGLTVTLLSLAGMFILLRHNRQPRSPQSTQSPTHAKCTQ